MIQLLCESDTKQHIFDCLCNDLRLQHNPRAVLALVQTEQRLELRKLDEPKLGAVAVDFVAGNMTHRRKFGGGRGEAVAKAVGIKSSYLPSIIDATAGLGRDAFILAALGCNVHLLERNPIVYALLQDGLERAYHDPDIGEWAKVRLHLLTLGEISTISPETKVDVVYLDPMFPHRQKSALVKKEMRIFQHLVGSDLDADKLLLQAAQLAEKRIVVKRPQGAPYLAHIQPQGEIKTKNHRFDLYNPSSIKSAVNK